MMNDKQKEALLILQEECAEVIQAACKISRFGTESRWPFPESGRLREIPHGCKCTPGARRRRSRRWPCLR